MKRIGAVLAVAIAWTVVALGASAQARDVDSKRVSQSRDAVLSYWTSARMRAAKPAPLAKPGGGAVTSKPAKAGSATEIPAPYTVFPTSTNGKVYFTDSGVNYVCSGTAISSSNQSVVWTAGHCVNEGPGSYHTNWAFVPAYRDGVRPYGTWPASTLLTTTQWRTAGNFSYDLGAAIVSPAAGTTLTATIGGGRALAFNGARSQTYNSYGYPAASPFNGLRLWMCASPLYTSDPNTAPQTMGIQCNMTGGSSGGGWVGGDGRVHSVNSYGYSSLRNVMFGPYQGDVAQSLFSAAQSTTP